MSAPSFSRSRAMLAILVLAVAGCDCGDDPKGPIADAVMVPPNGLPAEHAPRLGALGIPWMIVPWTDPSVDVAPIADSAAKAGVGLIVGLTPTRAFASEWNDPTAPTAGLTEALERAVLAGDRLAGVHLDHAEPGLPDDDFAAYLDATVEAIRKKTDVPISYAIRTRRISVEILQTAGFPAPPPGTTIAEIDDRTAAIEWASRWSEVLASRVDRVIVHTANAAPNDIAKAASELRILGQRLGSNAELWASVDTTSAINTSATGGTVRLPAARPLETIVSEIAVLREAGAQVAVRGAEAFEPDSFLTQNQKTRDAPTEVFDINLRARADDMNNRMRRCCLRDGQIVTVYDHRYERDFGSNLWQEDACWLTGLYTAAMSFKFAVTGDPEAEAQARSAWQAIHQMANVTPMKGDVVRNFVRSLYTQTRPVSPGSDTIKRWRRAENEEIYWVGDISVDQLSGWFLGVATYYDLVANEDEKREIEADINAALNMYLDNDLRAIEFTGEPTTFGNLRGQPVLALAFFQVGHHITGDIRYRAELERLMDEEQMHFKIGNVVAAYHAASRYGSDHFYSSGFYPLIMYEKDQSRRAQLDLSLQIFHQLKRRFGDAYADMVYAVFNPSSDTARRSAVELVAYRPELSANAGWLRAFTELHPGPFVPVDQRAAAELDFDYGPPGPKGVRGGLEHRFSGVGYLLPYWMGRYHGLVAVSE